MLLDEGWRFQRGGVLGAENPGFDDSSWRVVDLPHDWSIEDLPGTASPFDPHAISQVSGGFTTGGTGWYRKPFTVPAEWREKQVQVLFEGVCMNARVWLNGRSLGSHPYGYTSFGFDLTRHLRYGEENVLAVKVSNEGENSRWYSGSGIYRHVWLSVLDPVHLVRWGTFVTTPEVTPRQALVKVASRVVNTLKEPVRVRMVTRVLAPDGAEAAKAVMEATVAGEDTTDLFSDLVVAAPRYWSVESPQLYRLETELFREGRTAAREEIPFGIRTISFDAEQGFRLNGQELKLRGGCVHHDNGPLGARAYDRAEERRVELLKAAGFNAVRCAHNPPSPAFLDACDRLGMLVIDEAFDMWERPKNPYDYHLYFPDWWQRDLESMVVRDRNHPSVIMWSIGNEIPERATPRGAEWAGKLAQQVRRLDKSRPVTAGVNGITPDKDPYFAALDVAGYNYAVGDVNQPRQVYPEDHARIPERIIYGSESFPPEAFANWREVRRYPWVVGDFVWTAFDYLGEASIGWRGFPQENGFFPWTLAFCGDIDLCGWKRPQSFYRDALWKPDQLSLFVKPPEPSFAENPAREAWSKWHWPDVVASWNWEGQEGELLEVSAYSSCSEVELFLNGRSLGRRLTGEAQEHLARWEVPWQGGTLQATGYQGRKKAASAELVTAGTPTRIRLTADRPVIHANGQDLCYITVEITDEAGNRNPQSGRLVRFETEGPGTLIATGNANPVSLESYSLPQRKTWQGRCLVIIKAGKQAGTIRLKASADGLLPAEITLTTQ